MDYYQQSAAYYDLVYSFKNYEAETKKVKTIIENYASIPVKDVLEVACGTGQYIKFLREIYNVDGLDISPNMVKVAKQKFPSLNIQQGDMRHFEMGKMYDVVLCLFSSIAYMLNTEDLAKAVNSMAKHLKPGGTLIIEPFVQKEKFTVGHLGALHIDEDNIKISRHNTTSLNNDNICQMDMHYLVTTKENGVQYFLEPHTMWLIPNDVMLSLMQNAGLQAHFTMDGILPDRGLYVGVKQ